jgi:translation initiation factor IF-2
MLISARPGFVGNRPAIVAKVEPTGEEVKTKLETLEKLQGKGGKSKAAIEEIKRYAPSEI